MTSTVPVNLLLPPRPPGAASSCCWQQPLGRRTPGPGPGRRVGETRRWTRSCSDMPTSGSDAERHQAKRESPPWLSLVRHEPCGGPFIFLNLRLAPSDYTLICRRLPSLWHPGRGNPTPHTADRVGRIADRANGWPEPPQSGEWESAIKRPQPAHFPLRTACVQTLLLLSGPKDDVLQTDLTREIGQRSFAS